MSDFFSYSEPSLTIKQNSKRLDPVLFQNHSDPEITFLVDEFWNKQDLKDFHRDFILEYYGESNINYQVLYCFKYKANEKEQSKGMEKFYSKYRINFKKYIKPYSKVIPIGRAVYAITQSTSIKSDTFYDHIFNKTYFYSPEICSYIYPVDFLSTWLGKDNWENWFAKKQVSQALENTPFIKRQKILKRVIVEDPNEFLKQHMEAKKISWDIETSGFNYQSDKIGDLTLSFNGVTGYYLRWKDIDLKILNQFFENKFQIGANLKFDIRFLRHRGVSNATVHFDTFNAGHVLNEMRSNALGTHAWIYTLHGGYDQSLKDYKLKHKVKSYIDDIPDDIRIPYSIDDSIIDFQVFQAMEVQLEEISKRDIYPDKNWTLKDYFYKSVMPAIRSFIKIEMAGMVIDWDKVKKTSDRLVIQIEEKQKEIFKLLDLPKGFKINSNVQIGKRLMELGWPEVDRTKSNIYTVNEISLNYWTAEDPKKYKAASVISDLHSLQTLHKTFVGFEENKSGYYQYKYLDGRVHPNFAVMLADSGRGKCRNPNLQNVPKNGEAAKWIREFFSTPGPDYYLAEIDASGFQLRIGAALSGDDKMYEIFTSDNPDMHSITAQNVFRRDLTVEEFLARKHEGDCKYWRTIAKGVNFSLEFGSSGMSFAASMLIPYWTFQETKDYIKKNHLEKKHKHLKKMSQKNGKDFDDNFYYYWTVANDIRTKFFETYPGLKAWIDRVPKQAAKDGYVISPFGAIRRLPQLQVKGLDENRSKTKNLQNISLNSPVQNYESFMMMNLISELDLFIEENNLKSYLIGNVHDSVILYMYKTEKDIICKKANDIFTKVLPAHNCIPMALDFNIADYFGKGQIWGFGEEIEGKDLVA